MDVVKVRKQNRILEIPESRLEAFLQQGYDQIDEQGNVVRRATGGRYVSVAEYNQLADELEKAKAELAKLKKK
ncbi:hypothetical protein [Geobacillus kaustophilus]|uniref:hypothetical protein n=1 Tax=Geobacillus kaustophilus TaxID=1462 RepID=UPI0005CD8CD5|nr:hypothetical protein [Geobacillus kaustophilus]